MAQNAKPFATNIRRIIPRIDSRNLGSYNPSDSELIRIKKANVAINGKYATTTLGAEASAS